MSIRATQVLYGPYQVTFNAVDLGAIEKIELKIDNTTAKVDLVNGVTLKRDVRRSATVILTMVETAGLKTALAALFPSIYTTVTTKAQVVWSINTCGSLTAPGTLTVAADCDTATEDDFIFYGARPSLEGFDTPSDGPRKVMVRFELEGDNTGKLFQLGSTV